MTPSCVVQGMYLRRRDVHRVEARYTIESIRHSTRSKLEDADIYPSSRQETQSIAVASRKFDQTIVLRSFFKYQLPTTSIAVALDWER